MKEDGHVLRRLWMLPLGAVALVGGHVVALHLVSAQAALPAAVVAGVAVLVLIKHVGVLGPLYAFFQRRSRPKPR